MTRVTMADIARETGVSKQTVSRVVNNKGRTSEETALRVREAIARLGYRPSGLARSLATNRSRTLGLIVPVLNNPYFSELAQGTEIAAWEAGYNLFLCNVFGEAEKQEAALHALEERGVDGVIIESPLLPEKQLATLLKRHHAAAVIGRRLPGKVAGSILVDDARGIALAVNHLRASGRQHIALLAGLPHLYTSSCARLKGFRNALEQHGMALPPDYIVTCPTTGEAVLVATQDLLSRCSEIDALICFNDIMAAGALKACARLEVKVPDDVAVIGHDDILLASWITPTLTTLRVSKHDLGINAVRIVLDRLEGRNRQTTVVISPELVVRESAP